MTANRSSADVGIGSRGEGLRKHVPEIFWTTGKPVQRQSGPALSIPDEANSGSAGGPDVRHSKSQGLHFADGEVGTGKTTLLNQLLDWLHGQRVKTAFVFNSQVNVSQLFDFMMADFEIPVESRHKSQVLLKLNHWLLERYRAGETAVLIVDEAQNLSLQVLEEIRLLTNLETSTEKLLQIVLTGQPELEEKLKLPQLRQLRQRITLRCRTSPLTLEETFGYIAERLRIAGANGEPIFSKEAIETVNLYSAQLPAWSTPCRALAHQRLRGSCSPVPAHLVEDVAREFQLDEIEPILAAHGANGTGQTLDAQALLQNLDELLGRLREANIVPSATTRERKS